MIYSYLFQCYTKCYKNFACESTLCQDFFVNCLCYLGKFICVSISISFAITAIILLTWAIKWVKVKLWDRKIKRTHEMDCFEKLSEINRTTSNSNGTMTSDISDEVALIYVEGLLEIMNAVITNYYKKGVSSAQQKHEILTFHKALLCLQIYKKTSLCFCNLQIDNNFVTLLSECLDIMIDSKNEKGEGKDKEKCLQKFISAKECIKFHHK